MSRNENPHPVNWLILITFKRAQVPMSAVLSWNTDTCGPVASRVVKRILAQDNGAFHYIKVMRFVFPHTSVLILAVWSDICRLNRPIPAEVVTATNMVYLTYMQQQVTYNSAVYSAWDRAHLMSTATWPATSTWCSWWWTSERVYMCSNWLACWYHSVSECWC